MAGYSTSPTGEKFRLPTQEDYSKDAICVIFYPIIAFRGDYILNKLVYKYCIF
jgi:hypothetical protein